MVASVRHVLRIRVIIGVRLNATPKSIRFYFETLAPGPIAEGVQLEFSTMPDCAHSRACGHDGQISELYALCPDCGEFALEVTGVYHDSLDV